VGPHAPPGYECPFCRVVAGLATEWTTPADVVLRERGTTAFVSARWWPRNPGHVIVVPDRHVESLYGADDDLLGAVYATVRRIALAIRSSYGCTGTSTRQHNEPGGGQDVWHLHVHVFPRWAGDELYERTPEARWVDPAERAPYAERLRSWLAADA
jgi:histidine triad (HIT) family protein